MRSVLAGPSAHQFRTSADRSGPTFLVPHAGTKLVQPFFGIVHSGEHDRAIADFSAAIQRNPLYARAYLRRGLSCFAKDQIDRGRADLDKAICLNPKFAEAYAARGRARCSKAAEYA